MLSVLLENHYANVLCSYYVRGRIWLIHFSSFFMFWPPKSLWSSVHLQCWQWHISQIFKQECEGQLPSCTTQDKYLIVFVAHSMWCCEIQNHSVTVTGMRQYSVTRVAFFLFCGGALLWHDPNSWEKVAKEILRNVLNGFRKLVNPVWTFIRCSHHWPIWH